VSPSALVARIDRKAGFRYVKINVPGNAWPIVLYKIDDNKDKISYTTTPEKRGIPAVPIAKLRRDDLRGCSEDEMPSLDDQELWIGG